MVSLGSFTNYAIQILQTSTAQPNAIDKDPEEERELREEMERANALEVRGARELEIIAE